MCNYLVCNKARALCCQIHIQSFNRALQVGSGSAEELNWTQHWLSRNLIMCKLCMTFNKPLCSQSRGVDNFQEVGGGGLDYWQEQWPRPLMPTQLVYDAKIWGGWSPPSPHVIYTLVDMYIYSRYSVYHHQIVTQPSCGSTCIGNNHCYDNT